MPQNAGPAWIDYTTHAALINTQQGPQIFINPFDKSLYAVCTIDISADGGVDVYRSADNGSTWVVQDHAHAPAFPFTGGTSVFDSANARIIIACNQLGTLGLTALSLFAFNFATNTWSTITLGTGPQSLDLGAVFLRPDGSIVVSYDLDGTNPGGTSNMRITVYSGGAWSVGLDIAAIILGVEPGGQIDAADQVSVMDPSGRIHFIFAINPGTSQDLWYQAFETTNLLGHSATFPAATVNYQANWGANVVPAIIVYGNQLIATYTVNGGHQIGFITGTGLSNPSFAFTQPAVFSGLALDFQSTPTLVTDGQTIIAMMISFTDAVNPPVANVFWRLVYSLDGGNTWIFLDTSPPYFYYYNSNPPGSPIVHNADPTQGDGGMILGAFNNVRPGFYRIYGFTQGTDNATGRPFEQFWNYEDIGFPVSSQQQPGAVGGLPAAVVAAIGARGPQAAPYVGPSAQFNQGMAPAPDGDRSGPYAISLGPDAVNPAKAIGGTCLIRNWWDMCLERYADKFRLIRFPELCAIPWEYRCLLPWDDEFGAIPESAIPIHRTAGIITPATAAGDTVFDQYLVPVGYDGIISGFFWGYSGTGFVQGSGDIIWRMRVNQRWVKDLSNVPYQLGSPKLPIPMTDGQILLSGQTVQLVVNVPNLSGLIQIGASTIFGGLLGFLWPR